MRSIRVRRPSRVLDVWSWSCDHTSKTLDGRLSCQILNATPLRNYELQPDNICGLQVTVGMPTLDYGISTITIFSKVLRAMPNNILYLFINCQIAILDGFYHKKSTKLYGVGKAL